MGFRTGFVISSVSFLYGILFIAFLYDGPLIFKSLTEEAVDQAEWFYLSFYRGPSAVTALLHGMMALGIIGLIAKLHRWTEMAKYFDGSSLALYVAVIAMYGAVTIPTLRALADPTNISKIERSAIMTQRASQASSARAGKGSFPDNGPLTSTERADACRIIAAANIICVALLAGIVVLQGSEWWIEREDLIKAEAERKSRNEKALNDPNVGSEDLAAAVEAKKDK